MTNRNYALLRAIDTKRMTQVEVCREAALTSEARLSRIINNYVNPTLKERDSIANVLATEPDCLGFPRELPPKKNKKKKASLNSSNMLLTLQADVALIKDYLGL